MKRRPLVCRSLLLASIAFALAASLAACGGGSSVLTPRSIASPASPIASPAVLPDAIATGCIYPGTAAVTANLPSAGGVSGTITVGAIGAASSTCSGLSVATGKDASVTSNVIAVKTASERRQLAATAPLPAPLFRVTLTDDYTGYLSWIGLTLTVPAVDVPAGVYPATITAPLLDGTLSTQTYEITVDASGNATISQPVTGGALVTLSSGATGVLVVYPAGTVLATPSPSPTDTPSPVPSPTGSANPTATPTVSPTPTTAPTRTPAPTPIASPTPQSVTPTVSLNPSACITAGSNGFTQTYTATVTGGPALAAGSEYEFGWISTAIEPAFGITVPQPSAPYAGTNIIVGPVNNATVTVPVFGNTGLTGESGGVEVYLFLSQYNGNEIGYVETPDGAYVTAASIIAAGTVTCASAGL